MIFLTGVCLNMHINKLIYIMYAYVIFVIILYCIYKKKWYVKSHAFWDKQPVSRCVGDKLGIISKIPKFNIILCKNEYFCINNLEKDISLVCDFLNDNFSGNYTFSNKYLIDTLLYLNNNSTINISLKNRREIVGFIHAKPVDMFINNIYKKMYYVDFLCIGKDYRSKNYASILISKLISYINLPYLSFIFKKDHYKLPFNYINKTSYYHFYTHKSSTNINKITYLNINNLDSVYNFIKSCHKNLDVYSVISKNELKTSYINKSKSMIIEYDKVGNIKGVLSFIYSNFIINSKNTRCIDIEYIFINSLGYNKIIEYLNTIAIKDGVEIITIIDHYYNSYFISKYNMIKGMDLYFHLYNFNINKVRNYKICFNLL